MHVLSLNCGKLLPYRLNCVKYSLYLLNRSISSHTSDLIKKHISSPLDTRPTNKIYEPFWYQVWEEAKFFSYNESASSSNDDTFSMILPPPNLTGDLHMGHALTIALEDAIFRYQKLKNPNGNAIFVPGYDHAGIGMLSVLDKLSQKKFKKRIYDYSKEEFDKLTTKWKEERIRLIRKQLKAMGASLDFTNEKFTMSDDMCIAVAEAFIRLFDKGLIYRDKGMVNWCFHLNSTISDIEVDWIGVENDRVYEFAGNKMRFGVMYSIAFKLENSNDEVIVATTRPYTIPGDVAVAVNPSDTTNQHLIGKYAINPLTGRRMPIIGESKVSMQLGSGLVKITPACSFFDFQFAQKHNLDIIEIFDSKGHLNVESLNKEFAYLNGQDRFKVNEEVIKLLDNMKLLKNVSDYKTRIPVCSKSGDLIEYRILPQWYLSVQEANEFIVEKLRTDELRLKPSNHKRTLLDWIRYDRPWCISRQIAWGHKIPVYRFNSSDHQEKWIAAHSMDEAKLKFNEKYKDLTIVNVEQVKDVMDTWFSSSLIPFAYFGWPTSEEFKKFYPLSLMETGYDILKFWVHKMLISGYYLTGQLPFKDVLLHGMIVDANGKKMSKSLGNVIDPLDFLNGRTLQQLKNKLKQSFEDGYLTKEQLDSALQGQMQLYPHGIWANSVDGLRLFLSEYDSSDEVFRMEIKNVIKNRNLINKIWQSFNFLLFIKKKLEIEQKIDLSRAPKFESILRTQLEEIDQWILSRLEKFVSQSKVDYENNDLHNVYSNFVGFFIENYCGVYMEAIKPSIYDEQNEDIKLKRFSILKFCLSNLYPTMHPLIPFITEELYQKLKYLDCEIYSEPYEYKSVLQASYPNENYLKQFTNNDLEDKMNILMGCVVKVRWLNSIVQANRYDKNKLKFRIQSTDDVMLDFFDSLNRKIKYLGQNENVEIDFDPPFILDNSWDTEYIVDKSVILKVQDNVQIVVEASDYDLTELFNKTISDIHNKKMSRPNRDFR